MQELHINIDQQQDGFYHISTQKTAYTLRVYFYQEINGVKTSRTMADGETSKFFYYAKKDSSTYFEADGIVTVGDTYIDYSFNRTNTNNKGKFLASIIIYNTSGGIEVQSSGQIFFKENPATD